MTAATSSAIVSGGIAERAKFSPQLAESFFLVGFVYPFFEGMAWNGNYGIQAWLQATFGAPFRDFAGSIVVHAMGGWIGVVAANSLMALAGGTLVALFAGRSDPGFVHNGPLAGLVAICDGSDIMHPAGAFATRAVAGVLKTAVGIRLNAERELMGTDLSIHKISASPDKEVGW